MNSSSGCNRSGRSTRPSIEVPGERGYALIAVVGVLAVLSVIAVTLSQRARIGTSAATSFLEETKDLYAVEADVTSAIRAISSHSEFDREGRLRLEAAIGGRRLNILITDESRKIDVNRASPMEIAEAFIVLGADTMTAHALSRRVIDWRDADDRPQPGGAEAADYLAAGMPAIPRNDRFVSLDEVETVLGMPLELTTRLHEQFMVAPAIGSRAGSSAAATTLNSTSSAGLERPSGDVPSFDGIARSADTAGGPKMIGVQIRLKGAVGGREREYFRVLIGDGS